MDWAAVHACRVVGPYDIQAPWLSSVAGIGRIENAAETREKPLNVEVCRSRGKLTENPSSLRGRLYGASASLAKPVESLGVTIPPIPATLDNHGAWISCGPTTLHACAAAQSMTGIPSVVCVV